jgi:tetratricopeptide (TPR) repeat protein
MSFWDLASGLETDLTPIQDPSIAGAVAGPLAGVATGAAIAGLGVAFALATGRLSWIFPARSGLKFASEQAHDIPDALSVLEMSRRKRARMRLEQAIRFYERALRANPDNPSILRRVAISYAALGNLRAAKVSIKRALLIAPTDFECWLENGTFCIADGDMAEARTAFEQASELEPQNPECWSNLGVIYQQLGEVEKARACWEKVTKLAPTSSSGWINRGELAYALNDFEEGVRSWKSACSIDPALVPRWVTAYERGAAAFSKGDLNDAMAHYDEAVIFNPFYSQPWVGKALCERRAGNSNTALQFLDKALEIDSENVNAWYNRGNFLSELNRDAEAQVSWQKAYEIDHSAQVPWVVAYEYGCRFLASNQAQEAVPHFFKAVQLFPQFTDAWFKKGVAHRALRQTESTRKSWLRVLDLTPQHELALLNLGNLEFSEGNRIRAIELWDKAIDANPKLGQAAMNKAAVLADMGNLSEAELLFSRAAAAGHPLGARAANLCRLYNDMDPSIGPRP